MAPPRCLMCHRVLKDAASIASGLGPVCYAKFYGKKQKPPGKSNRAGTQHKSVGKKVNRVVKDPNTISLDEWFCELQNAESEDEGGECEMKYKTCPLCGSHLDYDEKCDCMEGNDNCAEKEKEPTGNP